MEQSRFIEVNAGVRYWEDATLNGEDDTDGKISCRDGDSWVPVIDIETGTIINWRAGDVARIHYKVCDEGEYWLLDAEKKRIAKWKGFYVPDDILCVGSLGYGDYIIFNVEADGKIVDWKRPFIDPERWETIPS